MYESSLREKSERGIAGKKTNELVLSERTNKLGANKRRSKGRS